jgi:hypothetical protein
MQFFQIGCGSYTSFKDFSANINVPIKMKEVLIASDQGEHLHRNFSNWGFDHRLHFFPVALMTSVICSSQ